MTRWQEFEAIVTNAAAEYGLTIDELRSRAKTHRHSVARYVAIMNLRGLTTPDGSPLLSLRDIASLINTSRFCVSKHLNRQTKARYRLEERKSP